MSVLPLAAIGALSSRLSAQLSRPVPEIYSEIELIEPDWQLFELPPDAIITDVEMPKPPLGQHHVQ
jgi:hypothetical protein